LRRQLSAAWSGCLGREPYSIRARRGVLADAKPLIFNEDRTVAADRIRVLRNAERDGAIPLTAGG
jgi:hypothetical protein